MRLSPRERIFRLFRVVWTRGAVGDGSGCSSKLSVALAPRLARFDREFNGWFLTILGVRIHKQRSFGGIHT